MLTKMTKVIKEETTATKEKQVTNFMGGKSYEVDPLETLRMVTASSIFGEPQYYRDGEFAQKGVKDGMYSVNRYFKAYSTLDDDRYSGWKTSEIMEDVIDKALDFDFEATLEWAVTLRKFYLMRLNPQVIMVRASIHPKKDEFIKSRAGMFDKYNQEVMSRADEPMTQFVYFLHKLD